MDNDDYNGGAGDHLLPDDWDEILAEQNAPDGPCDCEDCQLQRKADQAFAQHLLDRAADEQARIQWLRDHEAGEGAR